MIDAQAQDAFWGSVEDCLMDFHNLSRLDAQKRVNDLRSRIAQPLSGLAGEILYHDEPFDVACDLAGKRLSLPQHRGQYEGILQRHNW